MSVLPSTCSARRCCAARRRGRQRGRRGAALVDDLFETMRAAKGVGLAANQVGVARRVAVVEAEEQRVRADQSRRSSSRAARQRGRGLPVDPRHLRRGDRGRAGRPRGARRGRRSRCRIEAAGLLARAIQHEIDHLDGILFLDRLSPLKPPAPARDWKKREQGRDRLPPRRRAARRRPATVMRVVFFGTPEFAVPSLRALLGEGFDIVGVVTQPDRPQGRSRSTARRLAGQGGRRARGGLPVLQPERPCGDVFVRGAASSSRPTSRRRRLRPHPQPELLAMPRLGTVNVHASLLPGSRGAAPIQGASSTATEPGSRSCRWTPGWTRADPAPGRDADRRRRDRRRADRAPRRAGRRGADRGADAAGRRRLAPPGAGPSRATYAPKITRESSRLDWTLDAAQLARAVRAFDPAPGAWTHFNGEELKLFGARVTQGSGPAGAILAAGRTLTIAGAVGAMEVRRFSRRAGAAWEPRHGPAVARAGGRWRAGASNEAAAPTARHHGRGGHCTRRFPGPCRRDCRWRLGRGPPRPEPGRHR